MNSKHNKWWAILFVTLGLIGIALVITNGFGIKALNDGPVQDTGPTQEQVQTELNQDRQAYEGEAALHKEFPDTP